MWVLCFAKYFFARTSCCTRAAICVLQSWSLPENWMEKRFQKTQENEEMARFWQLRCPVLNCIYVHQVLLQIVDQFCKARKCKRHALGFAQFSFIGKCQQKQTFNRCHLNPLILSRPFFRCDEAKRVTKQELYIEGFQ